MTTQTLRTLHAARRGDRAALEALLRESEPQIRRVALSRCASRQDAEDATQETLLVVARRLGSLRAPAALLAWAARIVARECQRLVALARRAPPRELAPVAAVPEVERLHAALAALPERSRHVLVRRDVLGRSARETADELGLSVAAVKSTLHRARAELRRRLDD
jgi:RNA polymerase sigma factor (sigma-70 family)